MKVLLISSRFPWPAYTGDRLRATIWLEALGREADVTLVSPDGVVPAGVPRFRFQPAARSLARGASRVMRVMGGLPAQALLAAPYDWAGAVSRAREEAGEFDAAVVLLSRLDPWVRTLLPARFTILDAIDSLERSMVERAREASPLTRWFWRAEGGRVARAEREAAGAYDRVVVVNDDESAELGAVAVSNGVAIRPLMPAPRAFDFGFWGRLAYFANADSVDWLVGEIWPAIRAQRPNATLLIAGADAPRRILSVHGRDGITVQSPVADMPALTRQVRVALFPTRYGTGQSNKVLEAAEAGCAIVATPQAMRGLAPLAKNATIGSDAAELARGALAMISEESGTALRATVETLYARTHTLDRLAALVQRREAAA